MRGTNQGSGITAQDGVFVVVCRSAQEGVGACSSQTIHFRGGRASGPEITGGAYRAGVSSYNNELGEVRNHPQHQGDSR
jgi:hypothetical protein